ncbi:hypothetical protein KC867_01750 [Candidatus Saccharibacteria bacterium]|nr:hypothetical protein [Candidatus Saccharibacteria bacterium]
MLYFGSKNLPLSTLQGFLSDFEMLSLDSADFDWAFNNIRDSDFEDALQIAIAVRNGCNEFVTFKKNLASTYDNLESIKIRLLA